MSVVISLSDERAEKWVPIKLPQGEFEIAIRPPTFEELCQDAERYAGAQMARLERSVVNWRGLHRRVMDTTDPANKVEKSEPLPYSFADLKRLCGQHRSVFSQVVAAVNRVWRGLDEDESKN